jgi:hydroxymethylbilane synthase
MSAPAKGSRLTVGTRGSPLALAQTAAVCERLSAAHGFAPGEIHVRIIRTAGDRILDRALSEVGGKGLFTKEIETALASGEIDFAVHSAKDMPTVLPEGLILAAYLEREDVRDALVSFNGRPLHEIPRGARLGTASLRRQAQVRRLRPDLQVEVLRGNVHTRLRKVEDREVDATILGMAGLKRLRLAHVATQVLPLEYFLPAAGQGAVAIEARADDAIVRNLLAAIDHAPTAIAVTTERAFLRELEGSCRTPIGGYATVAGSELHFRGMVLQPDGSEAFELERTGSVQDAERIGIDAGFELKRRASGSILAKAV